MYQAFEKLKNSRANRAASSISTHKVSARGLTHRYQEGTPTPKHNLIKVAKHKKTPEIWEQKEHSYLRMNHLVVQRTAKMHQLTHLP